MIRTAAKTVGGTIIDLMTRPDLLAAAKDEWRERTGGGVGGSKWIAPLLPKDFRVPLRDGPVAYLVPDRELPLVNIVI